MRIHRTRNIRNRGRTLLKQTAGDAGPDPPENILFNLQTSAISSNTGGTDDFTSSGFGTPKTVLNTVFFANGVNDIEASGAVNIGGADGTRENQVTIYSRNAFVTTDTKHWHDTANAIQIIDRLGATADAAMTNITNGCRYTWGASDAAVDYGMANLMFGGSALSGFVGATGLFLSDDESKTITGVGFKPDVVMAFCSDSTIGPGLGNHAPVSFGFSDASLNQGSLFYREFSGLADSDTKQKISDSFFINVRTSPENQDLELTSLDADGFTVTARTGGNSWNPDLHFIALKLAESTDAKVGTFDIPNSTGVKEVTGVGFKPRLVIQLLSTITAYETMATQDGFFGLSLLTDPTQASGSVSSLDSAATSSTFSSFGNKAVYVTDGSGGALEVEGDFAGFTLDGYKINYTTVRGGTSKGLYLALR